MKKRVYLGLLSIVTLMIATSFVPSSERKNEEKSEFHCNCSLWTGKGCRADYWGSRCSPAGATHCPEYDVNCSNNGAGNPTE